MYNLNCALKGTYYFDVNWMFSRRKRKKKSHKNDMLAVCHLDLFFICMWNVVLNCGFGAYFCRKIEFLVQNWK